MVAAKGNKYALGLTTSGRPPIYNDPEEVKQKCLDFFAACNEEGEKVTITGLALFLGFCSRSTLDEYAKKQEFSYIIKRAKLVVENSYENSGQTIDIFALKNMDWKDKMEVANNITTKEDVDLSKLSKEDQEAYGRLRLKSKGIND